MVYGNTSTLSNRVSTYKSSLPEKPNNRKNDKLYQACYNKTSVIQITLQIADFRCVTI